MGCVYVPSWFSGLTSILLILFVTAMVTLVIIVFGMKDYIKHNWNEYRCNPLIIPFAGIFDKDVTKNFKSCLGQSVKETSPEVLSSWGDNFNMAADSFKTLQDTIGQQLEIFDVEQGSMYSSIGNVLGRISDVSTTAQLLMLKIKAIFEKVIALYVSLLYAAWSIMNGMKAIVKDPVVKAGYKTLEKF
jgi:hypothetical protein